MKKTIEFKAYKVQYIILRNGKSSVHSEVICHTDEEVVLAMFKDELSKFDGNRNTILENKEYWMDAFTPFGKKYSGGVIAKNPEYDLIQCVLIWE